MTAAAAAMTPGERVRAALDGEATDRAPFSFWYHFPADPPTGEPFVRAELDFYRTYRPDVLKVMHDTPYDLPVDMPVLERASDWAKLPIYPPDAGSFGEHMRSLRHLREHKKDDAPVIDTVHSVFATGQKLTAGRLLEQLDADPETVEHGLKRLAAALAGFAQAAVREGGCAGIFLAVSGADEATLSAERYRDVFLPLDRLVLSGAAEGWCNVVHLHGSDPHGSDLHIDSLLPLVEEAHAVSWPDRASGPSLGEIRKKTSKCLMGGIDETRIGGCTPEQVREQVRDALTQTGSRGIVIAPGCAVPAQTPPENLRAIKEALS